MSSESAFSPAPEPCADPLDTVTEAPLPAGSPPGGALPVFYDSRQRRWTRTKRALPILALCMAAVITSFVVSLVSVPVMSRLSTHGAQSRPLDTGPVLLESERTVQAKQRYGKIIKDLRRWIAAHPRGAHHVDAHAFWQPTRKPYSIVAGFYVNWEATSYASFEKHASQLTHLIPEWLHLSPTGTGLMTEEDPEHQFGKVRRIAAENGVALLPLVNNLEPGTEDFDPHRVHLMLSSARNRSALIQSLLQFVRSINGAGINVDFENMNDVDSDAYIAFIQQLSRVFHKGHLLVTLDVDPDDGNIQELAAAADYLIPMFYDQHSQDGPPGPIASQVWFDNKMASFFSQVPPSRTIIGVGNYAYDWPQGQPATAISVGSAVVTCKESQATIRFDSGALNSHFGYYDGQDTPHDVWMLDALSAYNEIKASRQWKPAGAALWVIGKEDRALWQFYAAGRLGQDSDPTRQLSFIPGDYQVDRTGDGEILNVTAAASDGRRVIKVDPATGLVKSEHYTSYPSPWVIQTLPASHIKKVLSLTFDDGPSSDWTPQILDILSQYHVPATFFIMGANGDSYPDLVQREWREGDELGNHTFLHPNLTIVGSKRIRYEVEATERLLEVLTGHSTRLFRAPYDVDTDPDTPQEVAPLVTIAGLGLVTVGANIDPKDYERGRTPQQIITQVIQQRNDGNIILMHDAGGDRHATVEALKVLIPRLLSMGYHFVRVTDLLAPPGQQQRTFNEYLPVASMRSWSHTSDYVAFMSYFWGRRILISIFMLAIVLGLARVGFIGILALIQAHKQRREWFDPAYQPHVTVLLAAYNEEKVIARTIEAALRSDYPNLDIVAVDDGSTDHTAQILEDHYGHDSRVKILRKPNGGKASALNLGMAESAGEILISIDADTLFARDTVSMLVRHFADSRVGAVAGNVKVGNPVNLMTRWQALEYITGQNFDRRAYDLLNCITVVPGAVGAWRRKALTEAGGYLGDTLAEDTDLTYRIRRLGFRIRTESLALGYTEAPESVRDFSRQRLRWSFGTLQCLWKHRDAMLRRRYGAFGWVALPSLWFYSIFLPLISPVMDLMIVWSLFDRATLAKTAFYYGVFFLADLISTLCALWLDRENLSLAFWLFFQRFFYRQLMYIIVWRALLKAWRGGIQGWGKLVRSGRAHASEGQTLIAPRGSVSTDSGAGSVSSR